MHIDETIDAEEILILKSKSVHAQFPHISSSDEWTNGHWAHS